MAVGKNRQQVSISPWSQLGQNQVVLCMWIYILTHVIVQTNHCGVFNTQY